MKQTSPPCCRYLVSVAALCVLMAIPCTAPGVEPIEDLLDRNEQETNGEELVELLLDLRRTPVPVNSASEKQLLRIPFLSASDASRIVKWREDNGPIGSVDELGALIGADNAQRVAPYLSFDLLRSLRENGGKGGLSGNFYGRLYREAPPRKGIETGKYEGGNRRLYSRVQLSGPNYGASFLQESDIGEPDAADFQSFSIHAEHIGILSQAVAGNYRIGFGQGLLFGQGRFLSKGTDAVDGVLTFSSSLRPYTSTSEENFMHGVAVCLNPGPFEVTAFSSRSKLDATITNGVATSVSTTGYHRTVAERAKKDDLPLDVQGVNLRCLYRAGELSAGLGGTLMGYRYGLPVAWLVDGGQERRAGSVEANAVYRNLQAFGEAAFSSNPDALSWICGLQAHLGPGVTGVASVRQYAVGYYSPFAGAFAERGNDGSNEDGFYVGLNAKVLRNLDVGVSYDIFRFPELASSYALPSSGHDGRLYVTWKQNPAMTWSGLYQHRQREETKIQTEYGGWLEYVMPVQKTTNRVQLGLETKASSMFTFRTKGEYRSVESLYASGIRTDRGWLLYEQVKSTFGRFMLSTRYTRFDTDSYDAAVYSYEDDLPMVYSLSAFSGKGHAMFILVSWEAMRNFKLAGKYERSWYADRVAYSSGNDLRATSSPGSFHLGCTLQF
jgi:hypothetical protein